MKPARNIVYPYKMGSASAKALAASLGLRRIRRDGNYIPRHGDKIVNWGSNEIPAGVIGREDRVTILNRPAQCMVATNKLTALTKLTSAGVSVPAITSDIDVALEWSEEGNKVVCRTMLRAHSGQGIVLAETPDQLVNAPLYVMYVKKKDEYRVHATRNGVFDIAQKRVKAGSENNNFQIRSFNNGWIFAREDINAPQQVVIQSVAAITALGLDFGSVDVGFNTNTGMATVYEVNTAPGLEGQTLISYSNAILTLLNS